MEQNNLLLLRIEIELISDTLTASAKYSKHILFNAEIQCT